MKMNADRKKVVTGNWKSIMKTKADLLQYYSDMSGNHLKYLIDNNHLEPEVLSEVKSMAKTKLEAEAREANNKELLDQLEIDINDDPQAFDDAQTRSITRKHLHNEIEAVFKTGYGDRYDGNTTGIDTFDPNPLQRNINDAERYTMNGTASYDTLVVRTGRRDATGLMAQTRIGRKTFNAGYGEMSDVGVYNLHNAAPTLKTQRINQPLHSQVFAPEIDSDDYLDAFFRR